MKQTYRIIMAAALAATVSSLALQAQPDTLSLGYHVRQTAAAVSEAMTTISGSSLESVPTSQLRQALEGQILGLNIMESSSELGASTFSSLVRGISTTNKTAPIFVIDGIIVQDYNIDWITAHEIESITVLKDAAATAIYGLKGANGVIVIETKHGQNGAFTVSANADMTVQMMTTTPEWMSAYEYSQARVQAWQNDGGMGNAPYTDTQISNYINGGDATCPNNNWLDEYTRSMATMERVGITLSGGTDRVRAWANINMRNQTALMKQETEKYVTTPRKNAINFRAKVDVDITDWVSANVQIAGNINNNRYAAKGLDNAAIYSTIFNLPPTLIGPVNEDGKVTTMENVTDPTYGILNRSGYTRLASAYLLTSAGLEFKLDMLTKGLSVNANVSFQSSSDRYNYSSQTYQKVYYDYTNNEWNALGSELDTNLSNSVNGTYQYATSYKVSVDYLRTFGKHFAQGHFFSDYMSEQGNTMSSEYPAIGMPYYSHNMGLNGGYTYDNRYTVNATLAITGSDVFPRKNRYTFVPSVSAAWNIAGEHFLDGARDAVQALKLRASYGITALDSFNTGNYRYVYKDFYRKNSTVELLGNEDLKAEKRTEIDLGLEGRVFDQLSFSFDWFTRRTDNMLIEKGSSIPQYSGISGSYMFVNEGSMKNSGIELGVSWDRSFGDWKVRLGAQWAHTRNVVLNANEPAYPGYVYDHRIEGYPVGQKFGYLTDGYINTEAELAQYKTMTSEIGVPRLGDFKYKDLNNDGKINEKDMAPIGNGTAPTDLTTIRVGFGWKGLDVDLMFAGVNGWYGAAAYNTDMTANGIYNDLHKNAWTADRYADGREITAPALSYNTTSISSLANDWNIDNRSFWRLKNASISYSFPEKWFTGRVSGAKIVLSGSNLFTLSSMRSKVIDPEIGSMTSLPLFRTVNLGFKLDF